MVEKADYLVLEDDYLNHFLIQQNICDCAIGGFVLHMTQNRVTRIAYDEIVKILQYNRKFKLLQMQTQEYSRCQTKMRSIIGCANIMHIKGVQFLLQIEEMKK
jgi:hypothetical protein